MNHHRSAIKTVNKCIIFRFKYDPRRSIETNAIAIITIINNFYLCDGCFICIFILETLIQNKIKCVCSLIKAVLYIYG